MKFSLSSLLFLVAVIALLCITFLQWRRLDVVQAELAHERQINAALKTEFAKAMVEMNALHARVGTAVPPTSNVGS